MLYKLLNFGLLFKRSKVSLTGTNNQLLLLLFKKTKNTLQNFGFFIQLNWACEFIH